jgi:hypothetical protein
MDIEVRRRPEDALGVWEKLVNRAVGCGSLILSIK